MQSTEKFGPGLALILSKMHKKAMAAQNALATKLPASAGGALDLPATAPSWPSLKAWREAQRMVDHASKEPRAWTVADAARSYSKHIGRPVSYQVWYAWEMARGETGRRIPNPDDMSGINDFTKGAIRADHFYGLAGGEAIGVAAAGGALRRTRDGG